MGVCGHCGCMWSSEWSKHLGHVQVYLFVIPNSDGVVLINGNLELMSVMTWIGLQ